MRASTTARRLGRLTRSLLDPRAALRGYREALDQRRRLARHPLFAACTRGELLVLQRWGDEIDVPAGVPLLHQHAIGRCLIAVLDGTVRAADADAGSVEEITAGGWVGDRAVLAFAPEPATVTTVTPCRAFTLGTRPVLSFATSMSGLRAALFPTLDEPAARREVLAMRAQGLAQWKQRRVPAARAFEGAELPAWLLSYSVNPRRRDGELATFLSASSPPATVDVPVHHIEHPWRIAAVVATALLVAVAAVGSTLHLPYYSLRGSTRSAVDAVAIGGRTAEAAGTIVFPIVDARSVTPFGLLQAWSERDAEIRTTEEVLGGQRASDADRTNRRLMAAAQRHAIAAVGGLIAELRLDAAAVRIDAAGVGGPSAGLAFALALIDEGTPGDLTGGVAIAATGDLGADGVVHAVGGIALKTRAARRAGCRLFILPAANLDEAEPHAGPMELLGVGSLAESVQKLVASGGAITATV